MDFGLVPAMLLWRRGRQDGWKFPIMNCVQCMTYECRFVNANVLVANVLGCGACALELSLSAPTLPGRPCCCVLGEGESGRDDASDQSAASARSISTQPTQ